MFNPASGWPGACNLQHLPLGDGENMVCIGVHRRTRQFRIDARHGLWRVPASPRASIPGAIAQHEAVTITIPGTACGLRVIVAGRQGARGSKTTEPGRRCRHLCATGDHHVDGAVLIMRIASPILCAPVLHADTIEMFGPPGHT